MSPKKAAPAKSPKASPKGTVKEKMKAAPKTSPKEVKKASTTVAAKVAAPAADVSGDDLDEDMDSETGSSSAGGGTAMPTLQRSEEGAAPMTPKNFRNHPDMENFFRFIYENDLRLEALDIIDEIIVTRKAKKKKPEASLKS